MILMITDFNPLSANPIKWLNTLKQFVSKLPTNYLSVFGHFVNLTLKGLTLINLLLMEHKNSIEFLTRKTADLKSL